MVLCVSVYLRGFMSFQGVLPRAANGLTHYLCRCQGGNWRQSLPKAPAHHCPVHNNFPEKLSHNQLSSASIWSNYSWLAKFGNSWKERGEGWSVFYLNCGLTAACICCTGNQFVQGHDTGHRTKQKFQFFLLEMVVWMIFAKHYFLWRLIFLRCDLILIDFILIFSRSKGN